MASRTYLEIFLVRVNTSALVILILMTLSLSESSCSAVLVIAGWSSRHLDTIAGKPALPL